ncbi:MAG: tetratricopeptide repeat protein, partial [Candidatus Binatia bacterium]
LRWAALAAMLVLPLGYGVILASPYLFPNSETLVGAVPRAWLYIPTAGFQAEGVGVDWRSYLFTQFKVILWYVRLFALPTAQCFDYGWPFVDGPWRVDVLGPLAVLLAAVGVGIYAFWRYRLATFCIGWFFITLAPSSSVVPLRDAAFEQRMYLPIVGLAWLIIVGGYDLLGRLAERVDRPARGLWQAAGALAVVWIGLLGVATLMRNEVMADPLLLAADSVAKSPDNWRAQYAYGDALSQQKRLDEAMTALEASIALDPKQGSPRVLLSSLYVAQRRYDDAERVLIPATALLEDSVVAAAYQQLGTVYQAREEYERAEEALQLAVKYKPKWWSLQRQLAALYARQGNWLMAARHYDQALRLNPERAQTLAPTAARANYNAALGMLSRKQTGLALALLRRTLELQPEMTPARHRLAVLLAADGAWDEAQTHMQRVARAQPGDPLVQENLRRAGAHEPLRAPPTSS